MIKQHIALELPFMATEVILMQCVKAGGDRQVRGIDAAVGTLFVIKPFQRKSKITYQS